MLLRCLKLKQTLYTLEVCLAINKNNSKCNAKTSLFTTVPFKYRIYI